MKKKFFVATILLAVFSFFMISSVFATNGMDSMVNGVRNAVGGAENAMEDAGRTAVNGVRDGMNTVDNTV